MSVRALASGSGVQITTSKVRPAAAVRDGNPPPTVDTLQTTARNDAQAQSTLKTANDAAYRGDRSGADSLFRSAVDQAATPDMARKVANDANYRGFKMAAAAGFRTAAGLTTNPHDIRKTANDAAYDGLTEAADAGFRRAADVSVYADDARAVGNDADYRGLKEAADYAWRRAASLPPAPPPPPKVKGPSLWSRIKAFFAGLFS